MINVAKLFGNKIVKSILAKLLDFFIQPKYFKIYIFQNRIKQ